MVSEIVHENSLMEIVDEVVILVLVEMFLI
jgi:hypothetical protein